ncbi:MAG: hypothetical protein U1D30_10525 [Planctomycetota bacterium]
MRSRRYSRLEASPAPLCGNWTGTAARRLVLQKVFAIAILLVSAFVLFRTLGGVW